MKGKNTHIKEYQNFINEWNHIPPEKWEAADSIKEILNSPDPDTRKIIKFARDYIYEKNGFIWNGTGWKLGDDTKTNSLAANSVAILEELQRKIDIVITAMKDSFFVSHGDSMRNDESKKS